MTKNYLDLSGKIDKQKIELYKTLQHVCMDNNTPFFIAGAEAWDVILEHGYDIETIRATRNIDTAIMVSNWDEYNKIVATLISNGFTKLENSDIRFHSHNGILVDLIPFGSIETKDRKILWPPEFIDQFNVIGFAEAFEHSIPVRLSEDLDIQFASIAGLAILKIFAWNDKPDNDNNPRDLLLMMRNHIEAGNENRFYEDHVDITEEDGYDYEKASTRLLGRDMQPICSPKMKSELIGILNREINHAGVSKLILNMDKNNQLSYESRHALLVDLLRGLQD